MLYALSEGYAEKKGKQGLVDIDPDPRGATISASGAHGATWRRWYLTTPAVRCSNGKG
jgi:hypothetical protein